MNLHIFICTINYNYSVYFQESSPINIAVYLLVDYVMFKDEYILYMTDLLRDRDIKMISAEHLSNRDKTKVTKKPAC